MSKRICWLGLVIVVAVEFLMGFHGIGHGMNIPTRVPEEVVLSHRDSLIIEMVDFLQPEFKLNKQNRKHIEGRIKGFPDKVVRRDTVSHFINTVYSIAYYEFLAHEYKKAYRLCENFSQTYLPPDPLAFLSHYTVIFSSFFSLEAKGQFKKKKDKNNWFSDIKWSWGNSTEYDFRNSEGDFVGKFLDDVPMDCSLETYRKLLTTYRDGDGMLSMLNGLLNRSFFQRCVDAGRKDILDLVCELWKVPFDHFKVGARGQLIYERPSAVDYTLDYATFQEMVIPFNAKDNKAQIDSLIAVNSNIDLSPRVMRLLDQYFEDSRYVDLEEACIRYKGCVKENQLGILHNFWGLALSNLGRYPEAIEHYDIAISHLMDLKSKSTALLNKGYALGEIGRTQAAVDIFMAEKNHKLTPFENFTWNDNLGYVYSFTDPVTALYYYNEAEKYLDSGTLYADRKIRHFCRKARVLEHNKFLQRAAIEKAQEYSLVFNCPAVAKGMVATELAVFMASVFDIEEADRLFLDALDYYANLEPYDLRMMSLNREYSKNLTKMGYIDKAIYILFDQLGHIEDTYGSTHLEYVKTLLTVIQISSLHPGIEFNVEEIDKRLSNVRDVCESYNIMFEYLKTQIGFEAKTGRWQQALATLDQTLELDLNPMQRLDLLQSYEGIARQKMSAEDYKLGLERMVPAIKSSMTAGLFVLSDSESKAFQRSLASFIDGSIKMGAWAPALELSLFRKGLLYTKKKTIEKLLSTRSSTKKDYKTLKDKRAQLNTAIAYNDSVHIPELSATVIRLERELANRLSNVRQVYTELDRTLSQVSERLASNNLAVDFIRYCEGDIPKFGAFLIDGDEKVRFEALCTEEELSRNPEIVWENLAADLSNYRNVYFCPDGMLNNIGIEYLMAGGKPANQLANLHRVFHLGEINREACNLGNYVAVIGVSDHNSPIGQGLTVNRGNWSDLPNVEYEVQLVTNDLKGYRTKVLFNDKATEPEIISLPLEGISTLHISTHGFYRNNTALQTAAEDPSSEDYHLAHRFLQGGLQEVSGLVLREGNISWHTPFILDEHDDLWTSREIELMNFPNLNLTVLSACDTGLGEVDSEGVWGLQRAFRIAGSKAVICSLNKVDDYWTAQFMDAFYQHASLGNTIYDSFQVAQRWLYNELPDEPEIWSSFILIE